MKPGSKRPGIGADGDRLVLRVRERAVDGAANQACIRALAECLAVPQSRIGLLHGARGRRKLFTIAGITTEEALAIVRSRRG